MNGGAYGGEVKDVLVEVRALDNTGAVHVLDNAAMGFAYRHSAVAVDMIFTQGAFPGLSQQSTGAARAHAGNHRGALRSTQPVNTRTGGSTFRNPPGMKAWELIDAAGCRGLQVGDAQVSPMHCNFLINHGHATAADIEALGEEVRRKVHETSGVELIWEIRRIGLPG